MSGRIGDGTGPTPIAATGKARRPKLSNVWLNTDKFTYAFLTELAQDKGLMQIRYDIMHQNVTWGALKQAKKDFREGITELLKNMLAEPKTTEARLMKHLFGQSVLLKNEFIADVTYHAQYIAEDVVHSRNCTGDIESASADIAQEFEKVAEKKTPDLFKECNEQYKYREPRKTAGTGKKLDEARGVFSGSAAKRGKATNIRSVMDGFMEQIMANMFNDRELIDTIIALRKKTVLAKNIKAREKFCLEKIEAHFNGYMKIFPDWVTSKLLTTIFVKAPGWKRNLVGDTYFWLGKMIQDKPWGLKSASRSVSFAFLSSLRSQNKPVYDECVEILKKEITIKKLGQAKKRVRGGKTGAAKKTPTRKRTTTPRAPKAEPPRAPRVETPAVPKVRVIKPLRA